MDKSKSTPEQRRVYKDALRQALITGHCILATGGKAMDAAIAAVESMENCPLFNCAKGAVFNVAGKNELDASIMLSKAPSTHPEIPSTRRGFSATLLTQTKNPSQLVRGLYLRPDIAPHAFLSGSTAEVELGHHLLGTELVDPYYYFTEHRWREHRRGLGLPEEPLPCPNGTSRSTQISSALSPRNGELSIPLLDLVPTGTVGAVALDEQGCIAVVTSTGGKTNKLVGRIGDTPSMGSGFWAEEWASKNRIWKRLLNFALQRQSVSRNTKGVGVSGTGDGDYFIRQATCATLCTRMKLLGESMKRAANNVVADLQRDGGIGGVVAVDTKGNVAFGINCSGMYRGYIKKDGKPLTAIFKDDVLD
ncbi:L-asparaginase [Serendipita vermifera]|nr:L-asparaginase [Serendipita vermifera]